MFLNTDTCVMIFISLAFIKESYLLFIFTCFPVVQFVLTIRFFLKEIHREAQRLRKNNNRDLIYYARIYIVYVSFTCITMHAFI